MFTKKPLGGMSCASCEKDIVNLQGRKADYLPWSKFPFRDPSERIARVSPIIVLNKSIGWLRFLQDALNDKPGHPFKI